MSSFLQKIKQAFSSSPGSDAGEYPTGQAGYNQKVAAFTRLLPYGLSALEPEGAFVFIINSQGQEGVKVGIPSAMERRKKNLLPGECALYNSVTGVYVHLKADGTFEINASGLIDGDVEITGDLQVGGDANIDGNLTVGGNSTISGNETVVGNLTAATVTAVTSLTVAGKDFTTHVHSGVTSGGSNTGPIV